MNMFLNKGEWKFWILIVVFAIGGSFELLKAFSKGRSGIAPVEIAAERDESIRPYSVRALPPAVHPARMPPKIAPARIAMTQPQVPGVLPPAKATQFDHSESDKKDAKDKTGKKKKKKKKKFNPDEYEIVFDPVRGKWVKRRKKKLPELDQKNLELAQKDESRDDDWDQNDSSIDDAIATALMTGNPPQPSADPNQKGDEAFISAEEWIRKLLNRPNKNETLRFIEHYKKHLVTDEVYYRVVTMMIEDSRPEMKKLGVLAAGSVTSVLSFQLLAQVTRDEKADASVRQSAEEFLAKYTALSNVHILGRILRAPTSSHTALLALRKLQESMEQHLASRPQQTPNASRPVRNVATYFAIFPPILTKLTESPEPEISNQARQTLARLQELSPPLANPAQTATAAAP